MINKNIANLMKRELKDKEVSGVIDHADEESHEKRVESSWCDIYFVFMK